MEGSYAERSDTGRSTDEARYFRPRRRPWLRAALVGGVVVVLAIATGAAIWLRTHVVPPDCEDPDTLTLVRRSLTGRFNLPSNVTIENIETHAGGYLAFRFACEADLANIDRQALPPNTPVPGKVWYVSRLAEGGRRHEVTVRVYPVLKLERIQ
jgi:hypothetical protein